MDRIDKSSSIDNIQRVIMRKHLAINIYYNWVIRYKVKKQREDYSCHP